MLNKRSIGTKYEVIAARFLISQGYTVLQTNFRCRLGEIDIIAEDQNILCFIEVKYRSSLSCGFPAEAVNYYKQQTIMKVSDYYMLIHHRSDSMRRYDIVEILGNKIRVLKGCFGNF